MTEYESLVKTRYLWRYLARHPEIIYKADAYKILNLVEDVNCCPCCQFAAYETAFGTATNCKKCPLRSLWPHGCVVTDSPYNQWLEHVGEWEGAQAALQIATAAQAAINKRFPYAQIQASQAQETEEERS